MGTTVVETYGYMAPEQFRGAASPASDLYGLGGTLLFLLSGAATLVAVLTMSSLGIGTLLQCSGPHNLPESSTHAQQCNAAPAIIQPDVPPCLLCNLSWQPAHWASRA